MGIKTYRDSVGWRKAMDLAELVYELTRGFPADERFGLTNQLRRASVSIASNIAEGQGRLTVGELTQFLGIARGSVQEVETQLELALRLRFGDAPRIAKAKDAASEVAKILNASITTLRSRSAMRNTRREN